MSTHQRRCRRGGACDIRRRGSRSGSLVHVRQRKVGIGCRCTLTLLTQRRWSPSPGTGASAGRLLSLSPRNCWQRCQRWCLGGSLPERVMLTVGRRCRRGGVCDTRRHRCRPASLVHCGCGERQHQQHSPAPIMATPRVTIPLMHSVISVRCAIGRLRSPWPQKVPAALMARAGRERCKPRALGCPVSSVAGSPATLAGHA